MQLVFVTTVSKRLFFTWRQLLNVSIWEKGESFVIRAVRFVQRTTRILPALLVTWLPLVFALLEDDVLGLLSLKHRAKGVLDCEMKGVGNQGVGKQFLQGISYTGWERWKKLPKELIMLEFFIKAWCVRMKNLKWFQHKCFKKKMEQKTA